LPDGSLLFRTTLTLFLACGLDPDLFEAQREVLERSMYRQIVKRKIAGAWSELRGLDHSRDEHGHAEMSTTIPEELAGVMMMEGEREGEGASRLREGEGSGSPWCTSATWATQSVRAGSSQGDLNHDHDHKVSAPTRSKDDDKMLPHKHKILVLKESICLHPVDPRDIVLGPRLKWRGAWTRYDKRMIGTWYNS
jgi:hypothetical protein